MDFINPNLNKDDSWWLVTNKSVSLDFQGLRETTSINKSLLALGHLDCRVLCWDPYQAQLEHELTFLNIGEWGESQCLWPPVSKKVL